MNRRLINLVFKFLFSPERKIKAGKLILFKTNIKGLRAVKVGSFLFIEQNLEKTSKWARMAKKGNRIMWIINLKLDKYLYRIVDGQIFKL